MIGYIRTSKDKLLNILNSLKEKFSTLTFNFECIFYRITIDDQNDIYELFQLIYYVKTFQNIMIKVEVKGG